MQVLINTDSHINADPGVLDQVQGDMVSTLARFREQLTRVEVHLSDQNAGRGGAASMRCMLEARPAGRKPVAVTHLAATIEEAASGAGSSLASLLDTTFGRTAARRGRDSIRHPADPL